MFAAILILLLLPITDVSRSRGMQFRPLSKAAFFVFVANFLILMQLGAKHVESPFIEFGQISTVLYFSYFTVVMYGITVVENTFVDLRHKKDVLFSTSFSTLNISKSGVNKDLSILLFILLAVYLRMSLNIAKNHFNSTTFEVITMLLISISFFVFIAYLSSMFNKTTFRLSKRFKILLVIHLLVVFYMAISLLNYNVELHKYVIAKAAE